MEIGELLLNPPEPARPSITRGDQTINSLELVEAVARTRRWLTDRLGTLNGMVTSLESDFSPLSVATLLALIAEDAIIVPIAPASRPSREHFLRTAGVQTRIVIEPQAPISGAPTLIPASELPIEDHPLIAIVQRDGGPGLVLFTSGTTGVPKGAVHRLAPLLGKFSRRRKSFTTIGLLLFDHWGGLNTLFHTLSNGGHFISLVDRDPEYVASLVERHRAQLLPASPTFLRMMMVQGAHRRHDLSSLEVVSYGAEPMPEQTLKLLARELPSARLQQTYGLIEVGVLRSRSESDDSLWVEIGGEGIEVRVRDDMLEIRSPSTMLGYLNAPTPITADGWFRTGDRVDQRGRFFRILGRDSDLINVGGEKVFPAEVESVISEMANIADVVVSGSPNPLTGSIVVATVAVVEPENAADLRARVRKYCASRLERYKIPVKVSMVELDLLAGVRMKKVRRFLSTDNS